MIHWVVMAILVPMSTFASEAPPADAHGAAPAAGTATATEAPPWAEVQSRMLVYKGQRQQLMSEMTKLREEQQHLKMGTAAMKAKGQEIVKKYKEYREHTEEYNKLLVQLRYRYPERLAKEALKVHKTEEVPSLEELEQQMDLDARLTQSLSRARQQYGVSAPSGAASPVEGRQPSSATENAGQEPASGDEPPTLRESLPIKVRK
ncbi:MAG: hypothetical protein KF767_03280 [Bdellovibrionaceae bacterium]|nr:hypothetical protein [Pseudobdellovibrionaceae bacterium]